MLAAFDGLLSRLINQQDLLGADGDLSVEARLALYPGTLTLDSATSPVEVDLELITFDASFRDNNATLKLATTLLILAI